MAIPLFVGAGSGVAITTGSATVSKTGAVANNLLLYVLVERGLTGDFSNPASVTNIKSLAGTSSTIGGAASNRGIGSPGVSQAFIYAGRVMADGTVSVSQSVGASGNDLFAIFYEFSGVSTGTTEATVFENSTGTFNGHGKTNTVVEDEPVTTLDTDRLALNFVWLANNQAIGSLTGMTGGTWTEATGEFASATGATATLQLQTASMPTAGTISGGTMSVTSIDWGTVGTALIPAPPSGGAATANMLTLGVG